jgi:hypothetical protein
MSNGQKLFFWLAVIILAIITGRIWLVEESKEEDLSVEESSLDSTPFSEEDNWSWLEEQKKFYQQTDSEINILLGELEERFPLREDRLQALAFLQLGTPYHLGCLGEGKGLDSDPFFRLDQTDCTVFILTLSSLLQASNLEEAEEAMMIANYREGKVSYQDRLHFTTDRIDSSPFFYEMTEEIAGIEKVEQKEVTLNKILEDGKRLINIPWEKEILITYLPVEEVSLILQKLPKVMGVAFLLEGDEKIGLDVRHEGLLIDGKTLFHASSLQGKVVQEDFLSYLFPEEKARFSGLLFYGFREKVN